MYAVNPNATPDEVKAFVDSGDTQVFAQAVSSPFLVENSNSGNTLGKLKPVRKLTNSIS